MLPDFCRGQRYAEGCGFRFPTLLDFRRFFSIQEKTRDSFILKGG